MIERQESLKHRHCPPVFGGQAHVEAEVRRVASCGTRQPRRLLASLFAALAIAGHAPAHAADLAFGEYLSGECAACHRQDGQEKGIPAIIGWPADQFIAVMKSYKAKVRPNAIMQTIAGRLSDDEMAALAAYYGSLKMK